MADEKRIAELEGIGNKQKGGKQIVRTKFPFTPGQFLQIILYLAMLILILIYFTGNGIFIYEK